MQPRRIALRRLVFGGFVEGDVVVAGQVGDLVLHGLLRINERGGKKDGRRTERPVIRVTRGRLRSI
jgi:hypothetical protein